MCVCVCFCEKENTAKKKVSEVEVCGCMCIWINKMVYQSSNVRAMSKSIQATGKQAQSHQLQHEESGKRMTSSSKPIASASHHGRQMTNENANVKNQCRRESQSTMYNQKQSYRLEPSGGQHLMTMGVKNRNDHKSDSYQADQNNDSRCHSGGDQRFNGAPMTDIPDDDDLAEVKIHNTTFR